MWRLAAAVGPRLRAAGAPRAFAKAAAPAAAEQEVVVPLKLFGLPARYASALYVAASKAAALPVVEKELATVVELAGANANFASFLADPSLTKADKLKGINTILENGKFSATTKQFFGAPPRGARAQRRERRATRARPKRTGPAPDRLARARSRAGGERAAGGHAHHCGPLRGAHDGVARRGQGRGHLRRGARCAWPTLVPASRARRCRAPRLAAGRRAAARPGTPAAAPPRARGAQAQPRRARMRAPAPLEGSLPISRTAQRADAPPAAPRRSR
jgi:hypothetical protein